MKRFNVRWNKGLAAALALWVVAVPCGAAEKAMSTPPSSEQPTKDGELAKNPELYLQLIRGMQQKGLYYASLAHLDAFALRWKDNDEAQLLRAHALRQIGQPDKAEELYRKLTSGDFAAEAYHGLGMIALDQGKREDAVDALNRAASLAPTNVEILNDQGYALMTVGRLEDAKQSLFRAAELDNRNKAVGGNVALLLILQGKDAQADEAMRRYGIPTPAQQEIRQKAADMRTLMTRKTP